MFELKILYIWDQAGVGCILAKYLRRHGNDVKILMRSGFDSFAIFSFYNESLIDIDGKNFLKLSVKAAKNYDIIHIHSLFKIVPELRRKYKDKRIILHYHGSEVRGKEDNVDPIRLDAEHKSDVILVSTPDLLNYVKNEKAQYFPNPVDTEHFKKPSFSVSPEKSLMIVYNRMDMQWTTDYLSNNNFNPASYTIIDRSSNPILYSQLPTVLQQYSIYVDIKYIDGLLLTSLSKTAIEALACGLKVLAHNLQYKEGLPEVNEPECVVDRVQKLYRM